LDLLLPIVAVVGGVVGLVLGADRFVIGAATLARNFGVAPLIVGMVVVGLGTSAPEMLVSSFAAVEGQGGIAVGNALGSNLANIGLVLGTATLIRPIDLKPNIARQEIPVLLAVTGLAALLLVDGDLDRLDGAILLAALVVVVGRMLRMGKRSRRKANGSGEGEGAAASVADAVSPAPDVSPADGDESAPSMSSGLAVLWLIVGLALLAGASQAIVWGAKEIAAAFGVSDLVIGLTVVAIGTSLPEMAASVVSAIKGEHELAVGNVIGSNTFNLLAVLPLPGLLAPSAVEREVLVRDLPVLGGLTILFWLTTFGFGGAPRMGRVAGFALLASYVLYMTYVGLSAAGTL